MSSDKPRLHTIEQPSSLDAFSLAFEYDISWADARKAVKKRTT